jgi:hypothetical protein
MVVRTLIELGVSFQPWVRGLISVMLFLAVHVSNSLDKLFLAQRKRSVTTLPSELEADVLLVDVVRAGAFDFLRRRRISIGGDALHHSRSIARHLVSITRPIEQ